MKSMLGFATIVLAACGGDGGGGGRTSEFITTWVYGPGATNMYTCDNGEMGSMPVAAGIEWRFEAGTDSDLIVPVDPSDTSGCGPLKLDVSGSVAKVVAGAGCTYTNANGVMIMTSFTKGEATLSADGNSLLEDVGLMVKLSMGTMMVNCTEMSTATSNRKM
jgi:hypothetical protein